MFDYVKSPGEGMPADIDFRLGDDTASQGVYARFFKRAIDVAAILAALPVILPLIGICAFLIRRDGGPAFYGQQRVGRNGEEFTCWKLRSMVIDAEKKLEEHLEKDPVAKAEWNLNQKLRNDPRITAVGRFIRKTSIDELPQLFCVLKGEMSLVGPRPFMPDQETLYRGSAYYSVRPGLTGLWQVSDRNETSFAERAIFDTRYASSISFKNDVSILFRTVGAVVRGTGM